MHSPTPGMDSRTPRSTAPLLPVMPMAVRIEPGIGCALRPRLSMRLQTSRTCSSVACDCMTTSMDGSPSAVSEFSVYGKLAGAANKTNWARGGDSILIDDSGRKGIQYLCSYLAKPQPGGKIALGSCLPFVLP